MTQKKLTGRFSISRPRGSAECDYIEVEIVDESSGTHFLQAQIKYADFALALTAREVKCEYELRGAENVGKTYEAKQENVLVPFCLSDFSDREEVAMKAVRALEQDGWVGRWKDALNHHNLRETLEDGNTYEVVYTRLV